MVFDETGKYLFGCAHAIGVSGIPEIKAVYQRGFKNRLQSGCAEAAAECAVAAPGLCAKSDFG